VNVKKISATNQSVLTKVHAKSLLVTMESLVQKIRSVVNLNVLLKENVNQSVVSLKRLVQRKIQSTRKKQIYLKSSNYRALFFALFF